MSARSDLADLFVAGLPATAEVVSSLRKINLDPAKTVLINLFRVRVEPTANAGLYLMEFELWVCTPLEDPDDAEDDLDTSLDAVIDILAAAENILFAPAIRATHDAGYPGWKITVTTVGKKE